MTELKKKPLFNPEGNPDVRLRRMIGGNTTNLNDFNNMKYAWVSDWYRQAMNNFWIPEEINLSQDVKDYPRLLSAERSAYDKILSFLVFLDSIQTANLPNIGAYITANEVNLCLSIQAFQECVHSQSYSYMLDTICSPVERNDILYQWKTDEHLLRRNTFIGDCYNEFQERKDAPTLLRVMMANYILEGIYFYSGFMFFYNLSRNGKMSGSAQEIRYINRDENTHLWLFRNIITELQKEQPELFTAESVQALREMMREGVEQEIAWGHYVIGDDIPGLNRQMISDYIRYLGMAVGASFADLAVILVDASQGVLVQTRRHARICALMGIRYFVFAVNKMDLIEYDEKRFRDIENQIAALIEELKLANVTIIPVSATEGDNVTTKSDNMPWYKGEALLSHLETVDIKEDTEKGFYMPVQRVCRPNHEFRGFQGQIENGAIRAGDLVTTLPSKEEAHVKSILVGDKEVQEAVQGQPVTIQLDREVDVSRGCVLTIDSGAVLTDSVEADILWMDDNALTDGKNFFVKIGTKMIPGLVTKINYSVDVNTGEKKSAYTLKKNEIASCTLEFSEKIVVDEFDRHRTLGELILIDRVTNMTSACGVVRKTFVSQDRSQIGKVDEQVRAGLKGQTPVVVEFPIGKEGITLDFAEQVEKGLTVLGKHTYLYHPAASENYAETVRHLKAAGLIVLLVLDENTAKDETLKTLDGFYANWQIDGITVKDAIDFVKKKSAFTVQSVHDGNYI